MSESDWIALLKEFPVGPSLPPAALDALRNYLRKLLVEVEAAKFLDGIPPSAPRTLGWAMPDFNFKPGDLVIGESFAVRVEPGDVQPVTGFTANTDREFTPGPTLHARDAKAAYVTWKEKFPTACHDQLPPRPPDDDTQPDCVVNG